MGAHITELSKVAEEARFLASETGQAPSTTHLLLGMFTVPNPAGLLLEWRRADENALLARVRELPEEAADAFDRAIERAIELASGTRSPPAALHLLIALARERESAAHELLSRAGVSPGDIAREALGYIVGPIPRRLVPKEAPAPLPAPQAVPTVAFVTSSPPAARQVSHPGSSPSPAKRATSTVSELPAEPERASRLSRLKRLAEGKSEPPSSAYALDPEDFPWLASIGRNLSELAAAGRIDPVMGRDREIDEALDVLGKRRSNNPVLVGDPGVGKSAIVEGVALELVRQYRADPSQPARIVIEVDTGTLVAGTALRGSLSEKLDGLKDEVRRANGRVIVFIDEIHTLVGAGQTGEGAQDAANELKSALARGEFPCIGATTWAEFQRYFAQDPALERRFVPIRVNEPSVADTVAILKGVAKGYAAHHGVEFDEDALLAAAALSARYVRDRHLPDKALAVLDHAGSRARREGTRQVTRRSVAAVVARMARIPEERVLTSDTERVLELERELGKRVLGHAKVVEKVALSVRRAFAGFSGRRPLASFIFLGPTGVGKTELARALADVLFDGSEALVRIDMSEFSESHSVAKLIGAPPGYVGFGEGGQLTDAVRRKPACVVLLDEIEKAHRDAQQLLLQLLDEGLLTDGRGRKVDFTSAIVVLTSNAGAQAFSRREARVVGFGASVPSPGESAERALDEARAEFPPELWNRIEERLVFEPLERNDVRLIAKLLADDSAKRLADEKHIHFELDDTAVEHLLENGGWEPTLGARPMRQTLSRLIEAPLADRILRGYVQPGDRVRAVIRAGRIDFEHLTILDPGFQPGQANA